MSLTVTTFAYTGAAQTFTVPSGTTSVQVECWGAQGGRNRTGAGLGGYVKATIAVTPGETLNLYVGGMPSSRTAPFNNTGGPVGGGGGSDPNGGAGGGGTDVRQGGTALSNRVVIAGGGGGGGYEAHSGTTTFYDGGAGGGTTGGDGATGSSVRGRGGTQSAGGSGGGDDSGLGYGGLGFATADDVSDSYGSGGGGGGYWGGGAAGPPSGGGGGGSSLVPAGGTTTAGVRMGNGQIVLTYDPNVTPNAPLLTGPANNTVVNSANTQRFSWQFSSSDPSDSQSAYDLRYSADSGATWTVLSATTPNQFRDITAGTLADGNYEWQVRTYSPSGKFGPYSSSGFFTVATTPDAPSFTSPTSGATISLSSQTYTFSYPSLVAYRYRQVDGDGTTTTALTTVSDPASRAFTINGLVNDTTYTTFLAVQETSGGLWSDEVSITNPVSFTAPETPGVTVLVDNDSGSMTVTWTAPTPSGGAPTTAYVDVWAQSDEEGTVRLATMQPAAGSWTYETPASGVSYAFQVVAVGTNGVTAASAWTGGSGTADDDSTTIYDGGDAND